MLIIKRATYTIKEDNSQYIFAKIMPLSWLRFLSLSSTSSWMVLLFNSEFSLKASILYATKS